MSINASKVYYWLSLANFSPTAVNKILDVYAPMELWDNFDTILRSTALGEREKFKTLKQFRSEEYISESLNKLYMQNIGVVTRAVDKMPDSRFLIQTERYSFLELIENSTMPCFATDSFRDIFPGASPAADRITVPITDPEFNVSYYLACRNEDQCKLKTLFQ